MTRHEWDLPEIGLRKQSAADRELYWGRYIAARPDVRYLRGNTYARWRAVPATELYISLYITNHSTGAFVRGPRGQWPAPPDALMAYPDRAGHTNHGAGVLQRSHWLPAGGGRERLHDEQAGLILGRLAGLKVRQPVQQSLRTGRVAA